MFPSCASFFGLEMAAGGQAQFRICTMGMPARSAGGDSPVAPLLVVDGPVNWALAQGATSLLHQALKAALTGQPGPPFDRACAQMAASLGWEQGAALLTDSEAFAPLQLTFNPRMCCLLPELVPVDPDTMDVPPTSTTSIETSGFMLKFLGTLDKPLTQDTYSFEHPDMGRFFLFIVPAGEQTYTATFNRLP